MESQTGSILQVMAAELEVIVDATVRREKALSVADQL
jgi:hypothetical protein